MRHVGGVNVLSVSFLLFGVVAWEEPWTGPVKQDWRLGMQGARVGCEEARRTVAAAQAEGLWLHPGCTPHHVPNAAVASVAVSVVAFRILRHNVLLLERTPNAPQRTPNAPQTHPKRTPKYRTAENGHITWFSPDDVHQQRLP